MDEAQIQAAPQMQQQQHVQLEDKNTRTLFLRNVDYNATEDDLRNIPEFSSALDVKIPTDKDTGRPRGYGFIEYSTSTECKAAMHQLSQGGPIKLGEYSW